MKWRSITLNEVKETVLKPEKIEESIKGRKNAFKNIKNKKLKVTFINEEKRIVIVTAIDKNK